ncbi:hypothetical protein QQ045_007841 [Rhodiola kirilowii]
MALQPRLFFKHKSNTNIVQDRLPKFTEEEVKLVKGAFDFIGINHYTTFYLYDPGNQTGPVSYMRDWHAGFAYEKNGVPTGNRRIPFGYEVP